MNSRTFFLSPPISPPELSDTIDTVVEGTPSGPSIVIVTVDLEERARPLRSQTNSPFSVSRVHGSSSWGQSSTSGAAK